MKCINGWTKETMINHIKKEFKGKSFRNIEDGPNQLCLYRGPNNTKCAVGMFIPDSMYNEKMDAVSYSLFDIIKDHPALKTALPLDSNGMVGLQRAHDRSHEDDTLNDILKFVEANVE